MIVILGVLLGIALPSYQGYMLRAHRTEAISALLEIASCQERVFASHGHFDTTRCIPEPGEHYSIRMDPPGEETTLNFTAWADPVGAQQRDVCGNLGLDQTGYRQVTGDGDDTRACWAGR